MAKIDGWLNYAEKRAKAKLIMQVHDSKAIAELAEYYASELGGNHAAVYKDIVGMLTEVMAKLKTL